MCGIVGYTGRREAQPILLDGLARLEYRGYDSSGVATLNGKMNVRKTVGRIAELRRRSRCNVHRQNRLQRLVEERDQ